MKIDITALEQMWLEAKKTEEENFQEKSKMNVLIEVLEVQLQNAQEIIEALDNENKELRGKLITFVQKGLQYLEMEANLSNNDVEMDEDFSFLQPFEIITKDVNQLRQMIKEKTKGEET